MTSVPETMRAMVTTRHGGPDAMELREVAVPRPGPGEALVRVTAAGCNNTDLWTREGTYGTDEPAGWLGPVDFPRIQGGDVAGVVVAGGDAAGAALEGTRVLVDPALYDGPGEDALVADIVGSERDGGFAQYAVVPVQSAHDVAASPLSDVELGALPIAYGTALGMIERGGVGKGDTVLVTGASGGVGLAAVQLAAARGARVIGVCSASKADGVLEAGADEVVDRGHGSVVADVRDLAPDGIDCAIDVVAGPVLGDGLPLLRAGGRWVVAGALGGARVEVDIRHLYLANQALVGSTMHTPAMFRRLVDLARSGQVRPVVAATYALEDLHRAQADLESRSLVGKLVVTP